MSKKIIQIAVVVAVTATAAWTGRLVYRARHNLVTIDVYQAPLASVIKQLERQTREKILVGKGLDAKVTLALRNVPLDEALDKLGQQAGGNWSKWHAVDDSERALNQLEAALRDRMKIEDAGWTNIAPQDSFPALMREGVVGPSNAASLEISEGGAVVMPKGGRKPVIVRLNGGDIKNGDVEAAIREKLKAEAASDDAIAKATGARQQQTMDVDVQASPSGGSNVVIRTGRPGGPQPRIRMVTRSSDGNGGVTEEIWSPEHVVLEQRLQPKLGDKTYEDASETVAREVAEKVKGNLTTLYVLGGSPGGSPFRDRLVRRLPGHDSNATNTIAGGVPPPPDIESAIKRAEAENYVRLTPEQRVQRAREKQAPKQNP